jgi:SSS family solute:Na+ symporter
LRWYWWRINAWSEISAMVTALVVAMGVRLVVPFSGTEPVVFAKSALTTTVVTTLVWVIVTLLTPPEPENRLVDFYRKVRPDVRGWKPVAKLVSDIAPTRDLGRNLLSWFLGCAMVYLALFGIGKFVLGNHLYGLVLLAFSAAFALGLRANIHRSLGVADAA